MELYETGVGSGVVFRRERPRSSRGQQGYLAGGWKLTYVHTTGGSAQGDEVTE